MLKIKMQMSEKSDETGNVKAEKLNKADEEAEFIFCVC